MSESPEPHQPPIENRSYADMLQERDSLIDRIREIEEFIEGSNDDEWRAATNPGAQLASDLERLSDIAKRMSDKACGYRQENDEGRKTVLSFECGPFGIQIQKV
ncbi:hypothetical protein [Gordonibacter sp. An230]|uniref:hypothetical protein n=1 Tax=Gordonibacter sp. An230 TaxID=1965592 RepID=UPI0013A63926|nr:hypothetical protein [Gordonibacter sp. An230]